jgi:methionyl aminopeptidase
MIRKSPRIRLTQKERTMMRAAGRFNATLMDHIRPLIRPGITTEAIDQEVYDYTIGHGHQPACLNYAGESVPFPKSCCISVNDVVCHGIPDAYVLQDGDIVNIDITSVVNGWHGDQSETFLIGSPSAEAVELTQCALDCLYLAIEAISPGCRVAVIGEAIVPYVKQNYGYGVVDKYVGHGIGTAFHQRPNIPHVPTQQSRRDRLEPGMCFTIEPMVNAGSARTTMDKRDGWTVRTADGRLSAQFEHTVLMTEDGPEILTVTHRGPQRGHRFRDSAI